MGTVALVVLAAIGQQSKPPPTNPSVGAPNHTQAPAGSVGRSLSPTITAASVTAAPPAPTPEPTVEPVDEPTPEPTEEATEAPAFSSISLKGRGDKVARFSIPEETGAIAKVSYSGGSNFVIWSIDADGQKLNLLVNTIGRYAGTVLLDQELSQHSVAFQIESSGAWAITIKPVEAARRWDVGSKATGSGDDVLLLTGDTLDLTAIKLTHRGQENFVVHSFGDSEELLVNEIGHYSGEVLLPADAVVLQVNADGAWTIVPE